VTTGDSQRETAGLLCVLLACFDGLGSADKGQQPIESELPSTGAVILGTTVLKVNAKHKASVHDPRRVLLGTLTPGLTWGLFGLIASGWSGLIIWAVIGAICGGLYARYGLHNASKTELIRIGTRLPANSSALLTFAQTTDPSQLLTATANHQPSVASVAAIANDLSVRVLTGAENPVEVPHSPGPTMPASDEKGLLSMIMIRYPDPRTAKRTAKQIHESQATDRPQVDLVIETNASHHRHVTDPKYGAAAFARSDLVSWGGFGVVCGAISGVSGGGILKGGIVTGIAWGAFGIFAGTLYGLWAGRGVSARRLQGIGPLLAPHTSMLLAWNDGRASRQTIDALTTPESQLMILGFTPTQRGAELASG
jgi:hypothetical protein